MVLFLLLDGADATDWMEEVGQQRKGRKNALELGGWVRGI
jgi:hypothetical protein